MSDDHPKPFGGLYQVRLSLDGIKQTVAAMFEDADGKLRATIQAECDRAIADFDLPGEIARIVRAQVQTALGDAIRHHVERTVRQAFNSDAIGRALHEETANAIRRIFRG